jgi:hypothetical protein
MYLAGFAVYALAAVAGVVFVWVNHRARENSRVLPPRVHGAVIALSVLAAVVATVLFIAGGKTAA